MGADGPSASLAARAAAVHAAMHQWDRMVLKPTHRRLKELKAELEKLRSGPLIDESADRQCVLLIEIEENLEGEVIYWVKISRAN